MQLMVCGTRLVMWLNALIQLHRMLEWARSCRNVLHRSCRNILEILQHVAIYCTVRTIPWCVQLHGAYDCTVCTIEQCAQANGEYNCTVRSIALHECNFWFAANWKDWKCGRMHWCGFCSSANPGLNQISHIHTTSCTFLQYLAH